MINILGQLERNDQTNPMYMPTSWDVGQLLFMQSPFAEVSFVAEFQSAPAKGPSLEVSHRLPWQTLPPSSQICDQIKEPGIPLSGIPRKSTPLSATSAAAATANRRTTTNILVYNFWPIFLVSKHPASPLYAYITQPIQWIAERQKEIRTRAVFGLPSLVRLESQRYR